MRVSHRIPRAWVTASVKHEEEVDTKILVIEIVRNLEGLRCSYLFNILWDCPEGGSSNPGLGSIMSIVACELE